MSHRLPRSIRLAATPLLALIVLTACGRPAPVTALSNDGSKAVAQAAHRGTASLRVRLGGVDNGYNVQAISPYTKSSINHLVIQLFTLDQNNNEVPVLDDSTPPNPVQVDLLQSELNNAVNFDHLLFDTPYRVRCYAYKAVGMNSSDLISTTDSRSYTDVTISSTTQNTDVVALNVRLVDVTASANATMGVIVTDGGFTNAGSISISKGNPLPFPTGFAGLGVGDGSGFRLSDYVHYISVTRPAMPGRVFALALNGDAMGYRLTWSEQKPDGSLNATLGSTPISQWQAGLNVTINTTTGSDKLTVSTLMPVNTQNFQPQSPQQGYPYSDQLLQ